MGKLENYYLDRLKESILRSVGTAIRGCRQTKELIGVVEQLISYLPIKNYTKDQLDYFADQFKKLDTDYRKHKDDIENRYLVIEGRSIATHDKVFTEVFGHVSHELASLEWNTLKDELLEEAKMINLFLERSAVLQTEIAKYNMLRED